MSKSILSAWVWNIDKWEYYIRSICETEVDVFWMKEGYYFGYELAAEDEAVIDNVVIKVGKSWSGIKFKGRYKKAGGNWVTFLTDHELTFEDDPCCHGEEKKVTLPGPGSNVKFRGKFLLEYTLTDLGDAPEGYDALPVPLVTGDIPPTAIYGTVVTDEGEEGRLRDDSPHCIPPDTRCVSGWLYECGTDYRWYLKAKTCPPPTKPGTTLTCHDATTEENSSVELSATLKDENGNPLEGETVKFTLQGKTYTDTTDSNGVATVTVPAADVPSAGRYTWTAEYEGNDYKPSSCAGTLTVTAPAPLMTKQEFIDKINDVGGGNPIDVSAIDPCEKYNRWCVNSLNNFIKWDERIDSKIGRAVFIDKYKEDNPPTDVNNIRFYADATTEVDELDEAWLTARIDELPFVPKSSTLTCHDATTEENSSVELSATLKDENGNPLEGETVKFTLQGKTYTDTTDSNGVATVTVPAADVPSAGRYTWTAEYEGNDYKPSSCAGTLTVTAPPPCTEGDTKCIGYNLYECRAGRWELKEVNSPECGYTPPIPCPIACVCAGTELVDCLGPIREFRDKTLKSTRPGRKFVDIYYNWLTPLLSPVLMKSAALRKIGQQVVKLLLLFLNNDRRGKGDHQG